MKLAQSFPAPELRTRILRTRGFFSNKQPRKHAKRVPVGSSRKVPRNSRKEPISYFSGVFGSFRPSFSALPSGPHRHPFRMFSRLCIWSGPGLSPLCSWRQRLQESPPPQNILIRYEKWFGKRIRKNDPKRIRKSWSPTSLRNLHCPNFAQRNILALRLSAGVATLRRRMPIPPETRL